MAMIKKTMIYTTDGCMHVEATKDLATTVADVETAKTNGTFYTLNEVQAGEMKVHPDNITAIREVDWENA